MSEPKLVTGPFTVGERPAPLEYQYLDSADVPINLAGYQARFQYGQHRGVGTYVDPVTASATVSDAALGKVTYTWATTDLTAPGRYAGKFVVGNGTNRFYSVLIMWTTCAAPDVVPVI